MVTMEEMEDPVMIIATRVGFEERAVIGMCNLIGNILSPNPAYVMMATLKVVDPSNEKRPCIKYVFSEMNRSR